MSGAAGACGVADNLGAGGHASDDGAHIAVSASLVGAIEQLKHQYFSTSAGDGVASSSSSTSDFASATAFVAAANDTLKQHIESTVRGSVWYIREQLIQALRQQLPRRDLNGAQQRLDDATSKLAKLKGFLRQTAGKSSEARQFVIVAGATLQSLSVPADGELMLKIEVGPWEDARAAACEIKSRKVADVQRCRQQANEMRKSGDELNVLLQRQAAAANRGEEPPGPVVLPGELRKRRLDEESLLLAANLIEGTYASLDQDIERATAVVQGVKEWNGAIARLRELEKAEVCSSQACQRVEANIAEREAEVAKLQTGLTAACKPLDELTTSLTFRVSAMVRSAFETACRDDGLAAATGLAESVAAGLTAEVGAAACATASVSNAAGVGTGSSSAQLAAPVVGAKRPRVEAVPSPSPSHCNGSSSSAAGAASSSSSSSAGAGAAIVAVPRAVSSDDDDQSGSDTDSASTATDGADDDDGDPNRKFEIEKFLAYRSKVVRGSRIFEYRIKWVGYPAFRNSWEPSSSFQTDPHLGKRYLAAAKLAGFPTLPSQLGDDGQMDFEWTPPDS